MNFRFRTSSVVRSNKAAGIGFLVVWSLIWSSVTLVFDCVIVQSVITQQAALHYPTVVGYVTESTVETHTDSEGTSYSAHVRYTYEVAGKTYHSDTLRSGFASADGDDVNQIVDKHPVEKQVVVHYNPADPSDALLYPGVEGGDLFMALFMTPFNIIMIGSWVFLVRGIVQRVRPQGGDAGELRVVRKGNPYSGAERLHVRAPAIGAVTAGAGTMLGLSFISIFIVGFAGGFAPAMETVVVAWVIILTVATYVTVRRAATLRRGVCDLIIDEAERTLQLPRSTGRREPLTIPLDRITDVQPHTEVTVDSKNNSKTTWRPTVEFIDETGQVKTEPIASWTDASQATKVIAWVREQAGLPPLNASTDEMTDGLTPATQ